MNDEYDAAAAVDAIFDFCTQAMRIVAPIVPAVKINIAFFERYLWEGLESYYALISEADDLGLEIIGDVKRGDIGHTAEMYATAHLQNSELTGLEDVLAPDAITIHGYTGADGIEPFAKMAAAQGKGVFVLVRTSNPSAAALQDFKDAAGQAFYEKMAQVVAEIAMRPEYHGREGLQRHRHGRRRHRSRGHASPCAPSTTRSGSSSPATGPRGRRRWIASGSASPTAPAR